MRSAEIHTSSRNELFSRVPALFPQAFCSEHDHNIYTVPQKHAGFKCKYWPRGKLLCCLALRNGS